MKGKFDAYVLWPLAKKYQNWIVDRSTEMRFASFFSGGFITTIVVNQPERKLAKRTSVRSTACNFMVCIKLSHDFFRSKSRWEWKICPKYWRFCLNCNMEPNKCKYSMGLLQLCYLLLTMQKFFKSWPSCKKKSPRTKKAHWNEIFLMKHSIHLCFHEMFMEHFCDNYVPQCWVELDNELSWLFTNRFRATSKNTAD